MIKNHVREKLDRGEKVVGTFFHTGSGLAMDAIGLSGMDYVIIDGEHSPIAIETAGDMIRAAEAHDLTAFVRVKEISRSSILKPLDLGAKGLIVPQVGGLADAKQLVEWAKYPSVGNRGMAMAAARTSVSARCPSASTGRIITAGRCSSPCVKRAAASTRSRR